MILNFKYKDYLLLLYKIKEMKCNYIKINYLLTIFNIRNIHNVSHVKNDDYHNYFTIYKNYYKTRYTFLYNDKKILIVYLWNNKNKVKIFNMYKIIDINLFINFLEDNFYPFITQ